MIGTPTSLELPRLDLSRSSKDIIQEFLGLLAEEHADLEESPAWAVQLDRAVRRQQMQAAAQIVRRLAHDFGNVLTGILGFSELALSDKDASRSPLHEYLSEIHRAAQNGAQYTNQLRLFARRQANCYRCSSLARVLAELSEKWRETSGEKSVPSSQAHRADVQLRLHLPNDLPAVAMEPEPLRQVLTIVLDNAHEAIMCAGVIDVSAQTVQLSAEEAAELIGDVRPGEHLEICVADNGVGLTPEAQRQLFAESFFSTKSRKRGFGLAMAYGILSAYRGGLELAPRLEGGTIARLIVPIAAVSVSSL